MMCVEKNAVECAVVFSAPPPTTRAPTAHPRHPRPPPSRLQPSFRYKMPSLVCRIEGRGNGIRTCIVNLSDIATALNRPPDILTKYFGVELGAQSRYENDVRGASHRGRFSRLQRAPPPFPPPASPLPPPAPLPRARRRTRAPSTARTRSRTCSA